MTTRRSAAIRDSAVHVADLDSREATWRTDELSQGLRVELGARLRQAERGEGLLPYDEAMADVDGMVEEILAVAPAASR